MSIRPAPGRTSHFKMHKAEPGSVPPVRGLGAFSRKVARSPAARPLRFEQVGGSDRAMENGRRLTRSNSIQGLFGPSDGSFQDCVQANSLPGHDVFRRRWRVRSVLRRPGGASRPTRRRLRKRRPAREQFRADAGFQALLQKKQPIHGPWRPWFHLESSTATSFTPPLPTPPRAADTRQACRTGTETR